jgi:hypothetical protein
MSNLKYAIVENEANTPTAAAQTGTEQSKPYLAEKSQERSGDTITRRAEEALDFELAQGRMPA